MTTQTFRCLDRVADLILLRVGERQAYEEGLTAVEKDALEFEQRVKSEWEYKGMIAICEGLVQSLNIKEVEIYDVTKRSYTFEKFNKEITFLLMTNYIQIYGNVPRTAILAYDRKDFFEFTQGDVDSDVNYMFFSLRVRSEADVNDASEELLKLFSCYKKK